MVRRRLDEHRPSRATSSLRRRPVKTAVRLDWLAARPRAVETPRGQRRGP
jgi:hypothetical protein